MSSSGQSHRWIRLIEPACTSCMICARECPSWCISIDSHTEPVEELPRGARERTRNVLDRFAIDWSLCMYCGICIAECPYDALEWVGELTESGSSSESLVEEMVQPRSDAIAASGQERQEATPDLVVVFDLLRG
jgi:NADH-quinone oxidoreductase subunit I